MRLNEVQFSDAPPIDGYGPGFWRVGGAVVEGAVVVSPAGAARWGGWEDARALIALGGEVDILFIGTGPEIAHAPAGLRGGLEEAGIAFEVMASPPAARTYNVLLAEGRRVAAALLPAVAAE